MKFACPKCKTKYSVADTKIPSDKTLRFTCKKCQNVFRLKRKPKTKKPQETGGKPTATGGQPGPDSEARLKTAAPSATANEPMDDSSTRIADFREVMAVKERSRSAPSPVAVQPQAAPVSPFAKEDEWFVLIRGKQHGPLSHGEVRKMWLDQSIDRRTYTWRDGMADWARLGVVAEFETMLTGASARPPTKPPSAPRRETGRAIGLSQTSAQSTAPTPSEQAQDKRDKGRGVRRAAQTVERPELVQRVLAEDAERQRIENSKVFAPLDDLGQPELQKPPGGGDPLAALLGEPTGDSMLRDDAPPQEKSRSRPEIGSGTRPGEDPFAQREVPTASSAGQGEPVFSNAQTQPGYLDSTPGQETRIFMATAGLYKRRRMHKIAAASGAVGAMLLVAFVVLDLTGAIELPGMGLMYDMTGLEDPNMDRAIGRAEEKLRDTELSPEERAALEKRRALMRQRLLGKPKLAGRPKSRPKVASAGLGTEISSAGPVSEVGIEEAKNVDKKEHDLTAAIMGDARKRSKGPKLKPPSEIQAPNLPEGLTQDVIVEVITKNQRAMSLCISQAMKAGENLTGKMEVELSITATGRVGNANIQTDRFVNSTIGNCTVKTVKRWRFPAFNGKPVTVIFPYVLSATM